MDEATAIADEFLEQGLIYTTRHRGRVVDAVRSHGGGAATAGKVVILVNEYSASAAELLAGALQDSQRALVVGNTTFGKGSVQTILELPGGAGLKLTTMRYYTPSGRSIQAQGIEPDIAVESPRAPDERSLGVTRERDLDGHLPAEGLSTQRGTTRPVHRIAAPPANTADAAASNSPPRTMDDVPANPTGGKDFALSIAYQALRGTLR